jgi:predicted ATPase
MIFTLGHGSLDLDRRVFTCGATTVRLTTIEARLLAHLAAQPDRAFSREQLQIEVWGYRAGISSRTVFTTIGRVRQKIEPDPASPRYLLSEAGGYRFAVPPEARARSVLSEPLTPFIGRARELDELTAIVEGGARLLSILGPGGIGKTRVAIELLRRIGPRFTDGAAFVALESVVDAEGLVRAWIVALGLRPLAPAEAPVAALADRMQDREQLVVCDNVEQIAGAATALATLVAACPRLVVSTTSRVRLAITGEVAFTLAPMAEPRSGTALESTDAGRFVLEQAARVRPGWCADASERDALAALCGLTEGSPLAMELAVAWLRLLEPGEIVDELRRGGDLLRTDDRDVPARHSSVRSAMAASFRLLADDSVRALAALAVIRGAFDRDAALGIAGAGLRELGQLVDSSMIRRAGSGRFAFHPAVRAEALARLDPETRTARQRDHLHHFLDALVASYAAVADGTLDERAWLERHAPDDLDLDAAFETACTSVAAEGLVRWAPAYYRYLDGCNRFAELADAWTTAKSSLRAAPRSSARDLALGVVLALEQGAGWAIPEEDDWLGLLEAHGGAPLVMGLVGAAIAAQVRGQSPRAIELGRRAIAMSGAGFDAWTSSFALSVTGSALAQAGETTEAAALLERAISLARRRSGRAYCRPLVHLGEVWLQADLTARAAQVLARALAACRDADDRAFGLLAQSRLGEAQQRLGEDPTSAWTEAIEEACAHHIPIYWWRIALLGLASIKLDAPASAGVAIAALGCLEAAFMLRGPERAALDRTFGRGAEILGELAAAELRRRGAQTELEPAALALIGE